MTAAAGPSKSGVSLVITNYQGRKNLESYLPANLEAAANSKLIREVIVADDGSTDDSVSWIRQAHPEVIVLDLKTNRGFGAAANAAFEAATSPHVLNISNDMVLQPGCLELLMEGFDQPGIFSVSARLDFADGRLQKGRTLACFWTGDLKIWRFLSEWAGEEPRPGFGLHHFSGAIGLYDRRIFQELGGFDDLFLPFYMEETDLFYRAWKRGYRTLYEPGAAVVHHHETSGTILHHFARSRRKEQFGKNRLLFIWKNIHSWGYLALHGLNLVIRTAFSWLFLDFTYYRALSGALKRLPQALEGRKTELSASRLSDRQVFSQFWGESARAASESARWAIRPTMDARIQDD